jgi:transposase-like protein
METKKNRKKYDLAYKRKVVQEYLEGKLTAQQIADREGLIPGQIYNWRVQVENRARHERLEAIQIENPETTLEQAKRIQELEEELADYRQKVADQSMMIDLLKKLQPGSPYVKKLSGYAEIKSSLGRSKRRPK